MRAIRLEDGEVSTLAGTGQYGYVDSVNGPAQFDQVGGVAVGPDGTLLLCLEAKG